MHNQSRPGSHGSGRPERWVPVRRRPARRPRPLRAATLPALLVIASLAACGEGRPAPADVRPLERPLALVASPTLGGNPGLATPLVSVRDVVNSRALVGRRVQVMGRCLAPASEHPLARLQNALDEWQLEAEGIAIYVIGPSPRTCSTGTEPAIVVTAVVAEDTLPPIGDLPPAPRRYLILTGSGPV